MAVSSDGTSLAAGQGYCARVRARSDRDNANGEVYGDYTYFDDGTGKAFTFLGYPDPDRECQGGSYLGASDYLLPQTGSMNGRTPFFSWKPLPRLPRKTLRNTSNVEALTITEPSPTPSERLGELLGHRPRARTPTLTDELVLTNPLAAARGPTRTPMATSMRSRPWSRTTRRTTLVVDVHVTGTPLAHVADAAFTSGRQSYYVLVSKDASFSNIVDYAFTQLPVYAPRSSVQADDVPGRDHLVLLGRPARDRHERIPRERRSVGWPRRRASRSSRLRRRRRLRRTAPRSSSSRPSGGRRSRAPAATGYRSLTIRRSARSSTTCSPTRRRTRATPRIRPTRSSTGASAPTTRT